MKTSEIIIRQYNPEDVPEVLRMYSASWAKAEEVSDREKKDTAESLAQKARELYSPDAIAREKDRLEKQAPHLDHRLNKIAIDQNGRKVGVVCGRVNELPEHLAGLLGLPVGSHGYYLGRLYVAVDAQGQGIGSKLLGHALDWAKKNNAQIIYIEVDIDNARIVDFYCKNGFKKVAGSERMSENVRLAVYVYGSE